MNDGKGGRQRQFFFSQGPGSGVEDHQERGQVQGGGQAGGERAGEVAGEGPPGEAVSLHHHFQPLLGKRWNKFPLLI